MSKILLTGSQGFIGKTFRRHTEFLIDYFLDLDQDGFILRNSISPFETNRFRFSELTNNIPVSVKHILHFGALTSTTSTNHQLIRILNTEATNNLISLACSRGINLIYASSAAVYGMHLPMTENAMLPQPKNLYAESKWNSEIFAKKECHCSIPHISTLRLFNVYGHEESHKESMASIVWRFTQEAISSESITIFERPGTSFGSQSRDLVYVEDLVQFVKQYLLDSPGQGILNFGTGVSTPFLGVAEMICELTSNIDIKAKQMSLDFFENYQWFTKADLGKFQGLFPDFRFTPIKDGIEMVFRSQIGEK